MQLTPLQYSLQSAQEAVVLFGSAHRYAQAALEAGRFREVANENATIEQLLPHGTGVDAFVQAGYTVANNGRYADGNASTPSMADSAFTMRSRSAMIWSMLRSNLARFLNMMRATA